VRGRGSGNRDGRGAATVIRAHASLPAEVPALAEALGAAGVADGTPADGLVYGPPQEAPDDWPQARAALAACFTLTQEAVRAGSPVVYLVSQPALFGRRGPLAGMVAGALVSGARAVGMEGQRRGLRANVLTYDTDTDCDDLARWTRFLLETGGASGDVIHLGSLHHGKVRQ
jgi:hypothetical protein